jgi:hypothetical protein
MRNFPVNVQIESMEDDGNSVDEMDNEFSEDLNDEWGLAMGFRLKG